MKPKKVVIIGGGFAGIQAAKNLKSSSVEVILIDRHNYQTFQPLLHQVATGFIEPEQVAYPIRSYFRHFSNLKFCLAEVKQIDWDRRCVETNKGLIDYDYLILATGSKINYSGVKGAKEFTWNLKALPAAVDLKNQIFRCFETASANHHNNQSSLLTFVIVGGGMTGVEIAGSLAELINGSLLRDYPSLISQVRIVLVHSGNKLLGDVPAKLHRYTQRKLDRLGVEVNLETRVGEVDRLGVTLNSGEFIPSRTVIWSAGVRGNSLSAESLATTRGKRIAVLPTLQLADLPSVYVAGDLAGLTHNGKNLPMVAPAAIQQGKAVAINIKRRLSRKTPLPFRYRDLGSMAIIGRHAAIAQIGYFSFTGGFAWLLWLIIHLANLNGVRHRLLVLIDWLWNYFTNEQPDRLICPQQFKPISSLEEPISVNLSIAKKN